MDDNGKSTFDETKSADDATFQMIAKSYSQAHTNMASLKSGGGGVKCRGDNNRSFFKEGITNGAQWYPIRGSMQDWNYRQTNDMEVTVELSCDKIVSESQLAAFWTENKRSLLSYMSQALKGVKGKVKNSLTQEPIGSALIQIEGLNHDVTSYSNGDFWRLLTPGQYWIRVRHPSYEPLKRMSIQVTDGAALVLDLKLKSLFSGDNRAAAAAASKSNMLLLMLGLGLMSISCCLFSFVCYSKRRNKQLNGDLKFNKTTTTTTTTIKYSKLNNHDKRKLLSNDDVDNHHDSNEDEDEIFIK
jgi:hypothetical protein